MVKREWKSLLHNPLLIVVLIAILLIPSIYAGLFLASMWDPYGDLGNMPVAVVNLDQGVEYEGKTLTVGDDLVEKLEENDSLAFNFVDADAAERGLTNGTFYMVVTIPENFSHCASTLMDDEPEQMQLLYKTNPATNYVAMKLSESAMTKIEAELQTAVVKTYTESVFDQLNDIGDSLQEAADGTQELRDGEGDLVDGVGDLKDGSQKLADGTGDLRDGAKKLKKGTSDLKDGTGTLKKGTSDLKGGTGTLKKGASDLKAGTGTLKSGAGELKKGASDLKDGTGTLKSGAGELKKGASDLKDGTGTLKSGTGDLKKGASDLKDGTGTLKSGTSQLSTGTFTLSEGLKAYLSGEENLNGGIQTLAGSSPGLSTGATSLSQGIEKAKEGSSALVAGYEGDKGAVAGAKAVAAGAKELNEGVQGISAIQLTDQEKADIQKKGAAGASAYAEQFAGQICDNMAASISGQSGAVASSLKNNEKLMTVLKAGFAALDGKTAGNASNYDAQAKQLVEQLSSGVTTTISASVKSDSSKGAMKQQLSSNLATLGGGVAVQTAESVVTEVNTELTPKLQKLGAGTKQLAEGSSALSTGVNQLYAGTKQLDSGMEDLYKGAAQLQAGADKVNNGIQELSVGSDTLTQNNPTLRTGAATAAAGAKSVDEGAAALDEGAGTLKAGAEQLDTGAAALDEGAGKLKDGTVTLDSGAAALDEGAGKLKDGTAALDQGAKDLDNGAGKLNNGAKALDEGAGKLNNGAKALDEGAGKLNNGAGDLYDGSRKLDDGANELNEGVITLNDALPDLTDGTDELKDGLQDGATEIADTNTGDKQAEMYSDPVAVVETKETDVPDNGHAMAAYMMSVGLWVACLAFCLMYPLTKHEGEMTSGLAWWFSKATVLYPLAILQAVVLIGILHFALGFSPARMGETIAVACLTSVAFMSIMYYFNVLMGKVGSFIMLIFMVLQLAGSAGTYPLELSGPLANALHKFVPFTYTVDAFRSTIGGGQPFPQAIAVLTGILVVFSGLTIGLFLMRSSMEAHGRLTIHDWMESKGLA